MRMHIYANKKDAKKTYQVVNQSMIFSIVAIKWYSKFFLGGMGNMGPPGLKQISKVGAEVAGGCLVEGPFQAHLLKSTLWKKMCF